ncbi:phage head closure protein [Aureliella helgolandensis]|uniref:Phage head-tail joining protein n=1 Tax=Aureliella helgolandensis TaxID=2527968 RepID=A0A518G721_9BACT|nr:phage head closure protein [Aureliella helgolandensis]QDV24389.1 Phage head-tail joining protein [Aureliella helgolandensis]
MTAVRQQSRFRHRVGFQRRDEQLDDLGRAKRDAGDWETYATRWAEVKELSGREAEKAKQVAADASIAIAVRWFPDAKSTDRLTYRGRIFEIKAIIDPDASRRELTILCGEDRRP